MFNFKWIIENQVCELDINDIDEARGIYKALCAAKKKGEVKQMRMLDTKTNTVYSPEVVKDMTWAVGVVFKDGGAVYTYESDEEIPVKTNGQLTEVLVAPKGVYTTAFVTSCEQVERSELYIRAKTKTPSKILAIIRRIKKAYA